MDTAELTPELLLRAYAVGYFPMADARCSDDLYWLCPEMRGIIPLEQFHVPKRFKRWLKNQSVHVQSDTAFGEVIRLCSAPRAKNDETWISKKLENLYKILFDMGAAHSVEVWREGQLIGGLYGVVLGGAFFGESMFSRESNASKIGLHALVQHLKKQGFSLLDCQFMNEHLRQFGAIEIPKQEYLKILIKAIHDPVTFECIHSD